MSIKEAVMIQSIQKAANHFLNNVEYRGSRNEQMIFNEARKIASRIIHLIENDEVAKREPRLRARLIIGEGRKFKEMIKRFEDAVRCPIKEEEAEEDDFVPHKKLKWSSISGGVCFRNDESHFAEPSSDLVAQLNACIIPPGQEPAIDRDDARSLIERLNSHFAEPHQQNIVAQLNDIHQPQPTCIIPPLGQEHVVFEEQDVGAPTSCTEPIHQDDEWGRNCAVRAMAADQNPPHMIDSLEQIHMIGHPTHHRFLESQDVPEQPRIQQEFPPEDGWAEERL